LCRFFYSTPIISAVPLPVSPPPFLFSVLHCKNEQHIFKALELSTKARVCFTLDPENSADTSNTLLTSPLSVTPQNSNQVFPDLKPPRVFIHFWRFQAVELRNTSRIARQTQSRPTSSSLSRLKYSSRPQSQCLLHNLNAISRLSPYLLPVNASLNVKIHGVPMAGRKRPQDMVSDIVGPSSPGFRPSFTDLRKRRPKV
jgi:hypothetical protein